MIWPQPITGVGAIIPLHHPAARAQALPIISIELMEAWEETGPACQTAVSLYPPDRPWEAWRGSLLGATEARNLSVRTNILKKRSLPGVSAPAPINGSA